jgi:hypothetical protein
VTLRQEMEYHAHGKESVAACAQSKERQHDYQSTAVFNQVTMCEPKFTVMFNWSQPKP